MEGALVQEVIRDPSQEQASKVLSEITPNILQDSMPVILHKLDNGESSEKLAENSVDKILTTVEETVLGESFDFVYEKFGDKILDMIVNGAFLQIFEKVGLLFS